MSGNGAKEIIIGEIQLYESAVIGHEIVVYRALEQVVFSINGFQAGHFVKSGGKIPRQLVVVQPEQFELRKILKCRRNRTCQDIVRQLSIERDTMSKTSDSFILPSATSERITYKQKVQIAQGPDAIGNSTD